MSEQLQIRPRVTLKELLEAMQEFDNGISTVDFDPKEVCESIADKVDDIKYVIDKMEFQAEWMRQQADPFMKAAYALEKNTKRLKDYVVFSMQGNGFDSLPGNTFQAKLQNNQPSLEITQKECSATDFMKYPNYVEQVRHYVWKNKEIKDALVSKRKDAADTARTFSVPELPFAKLSVGQQVRFTIKKPELKK